jgi:hypothetical protein
MEIHISFGLVLEFVPIDDHDARFPIVGVNFLNDASTRLDHHSLHVDSDAATSIRVQIKTLAWAGDVPDGTSEISKSYFAMASNSLSTYAGMV